MKIGAIIQARTTSTRLPNKVLKDLSGHSLLWHVIERVKASEKIDYVILAITTNPQDDPLVEIASMTDTGLFRGSEDDVLSRYLGAAAKYELDMIVRITSDCPLIDPHTIDKVIESHIKTGADYTSNTLERTYPRGLDIEIFSTDLLKLAGQETNEIFQREHVTPYFYQNPVKFKLNNVPADEGLAHPEYRLCVDTPEDFQLIEKIYSKLYESPKLIEIMDVISLLGSKPELAEINRDIEQKELK